MLKSILAVISLTTGDVVPRESPCKTCYCHEDEHDIYKIECETLMCLPCVGQVEDDGSCCGICHMDGCLYNGQLYGNGKFLYLLDTAAAVLKQTVFWRHCGNE